MDVSFILPCHWGSLGLRFLRSNQSDNSLLLLWAEGCEEVEEEWWFLLNRSYFPVGCKVCREREGKIRPQLLVRSVKRITWRWMDRNHWVHCCLHCSCSVRSLLSGGRRGLLWAAVTVEVSESWSWEPMSWTWAKTSRDFPSLRPRANQEAFGVPVQL